MILVDVNLLLYAVFADAPQHAEARDWLDVTLVGAEPVALPWLVLGGFIRIATNPRAMTHPLSLEEAITRVEEWLALPAVRIIGPTHRHQVEFARMLRGAQATGNLVTDAVLAALTIEHACTLASTDTDFDRFPGLNWFNPLLRPVG